MELDDFDAYMRAKREEQRLLPSQFWPDFLLTLLFIATFATFIAGFALAAPIIRDFFVR
jgi:hypothetical protein